MSGWCKPRTWAEARDSLGTRNSRFFVRLTSNQCSSQSAYKCAHHYLRMALSSPLCHHKARASQILSTLARMNENFQADDLQCSTEPQRVCQSHLTTEWDSTPAFALIFRTEAEGRPFSSRDLVQGAVRYTPTASCAL